MCECVCECVCESVCESVCVCVFFSTPQHPFRVGRQALINFCQLTAAGNPPIFVRGDSAVLSNHLVIPRRVFGPVPKVRCTGIVSAEQDMAKRIEIEIGKISGVRNLVCEKYSDLSDATPRLSSTAAQQKPSAAAQRRHSPYRAAMQEAPSAAACLSSLSSAAMGLVAW